MHLLLGNEDVRNIIAKHYDIPLEDVGIDEENQFEIEITTCSALDVCIPKIKNKGE